MLFHASGFEPEQGIEKIVGISAEKSSGQTHNPFCTRSQSTECIALSGIARELVNLVANGIVEPSGHVTSDELDGGHPPDFVSISLPQSAVERMAGLPFPRLDRF